MQSETFSWKGQAAGFGLYFLASRVGVYFVLAAVLIPAGEQADEWLPAAVWVSYLWRILAGIAAGFVCAIWFPRREVAAATQLGMIIASVDAVGAYRNLPAGESLDYPFLVTFLALLLGATVLGGWFRGRRLIGQGDASDPGAARS